MSDDIEYRLDLDNLDSSPKRNKSKLIKPSQAPNETLVLDVISAEEEVESANVVERSTLEATALVNQRIGRKAVIDAFSKLLTVSDLIDLSRIKETRSYRGAQVVFEGKLLTVSTWQQFCEYCEERSYKTIDLEILNLDSLGQPTFEAMRKIGIGPSTMRAIRQLPSDDRDVIEQVANTSNKDELIDLVDGLVAKHQREKSELVATNDELIQDLASSGKSISNMNAEIERLESANERLKGKQRLTKFEHQTEAVRDECMHLQAGFELNLNSLQKLFNDEFYAEPTPESQLRIEQVYVAISVAASRVFAMLEEVRELIPDFAPERIQGQHILTPEEAERWLLDSQVLASKHETDKLARDVKRENAKEGKRGRKIGSSNKVEG